LHIFEKLLNHLLVSYKEYESDEAASSNKGIYTFIVFTLINMGCCQFTHHFALDFNEISIKPDPENSNPLKSTRDMKYELSEFNDVSLDSEIEEEATQIKKIEYEPISESVDNFSTIPDNISQFCKLTNSFNIEEAIIHHSPKSKVVSNARFFRNTETRKHFTPPAYITRRQAYEAARNIRSKPCSFVNSPSVMRSQEGSIQAKACKQDEDETQVISYTIT
jgi:hypothetical protein